MANELNPMSLLPPPEAVITPKRHRILNDAEPPGIDEWSRTKRRRPSKGDENVSSCGDDHDHDELEEKYAAHCLKMLSCSGGGFYPELDSAPRSDPCDYVCGGSFSTNQALDGHKTEHREKQPANAAPECLNKVSSSAALAPNDPSGAGTHRYTICHEVFATGPALGGHNKREANKSAGSRGTINSSSNVANPVWSFDLNRPE